MIKSETRFYYVINYSFQSFQKWLIVDDNVRDTNTNYLLAIQWLGKWMRNIWMKREGGSPQRYAGGPSFVVTPLIVKDKIIIDTSRYFTNFTRWSQIGQLSPLFCSHSPDGAAHGIKATAIYPVLMNLMLARLFDDDVNCILYSFQFCYIF